MIFTDPKNLWSIMHSCACKCWYFDIIMFPHRCSFISSPVNKKTCGIKTLTLLHSILYCKQPIRFYFSYSILYIYPQLLMVWRSDCGTFFQPNEIPGAMRSAVSSYAAMRMVAGSRPDLIIAWEWHVGLALFCGCLGALEYPTTNSCGPISKSHPFIHRHLV